MGTTGPLCVSRATQGPVLRTLWKRSGGALRRACGPLRLELLVQARWVTVHAMLGSYPGATDRMLSPHPTSAPSTEQCGSLRSQVGPPMRPGLICPGSNESIQPGISSLCAVSNGVAAAVASQRLQSVAHPCVLPAVGPPPHDSREVHPRCSRQRPVNHHGCGGLGLGGC